MEFLLEEEINKFINKFKNLQNLKVGDKLYYNNNNVEILQNGYFQSLTRLVYSQNRIKFYDEFKKDITRLNKILKHLINKNNNIIIFSLNFPTINKIKNIHKILIKTLKTQITTYQTDLEYVGKLNKLLESIYVFY
ncbi:hypothetical protein crov076 [Cafeteria roenbergensis virus]|uniref:Uncharacterized protein n=1 Tax=Cafeteria roenbergensis virus (strain BV-PW1) TaxID=693272 RepID=E3T4J6_CROVB|nr:hypothetical protein crov076 [Cafeteria roenbergensis virus BV-PW1]ADO67109.1 hypothetical protein crov076 [Cafeteria roenbergensis virus BV-PW1]